MTHLLAAHFPGGLVGALDFAVFSAACFWCWVIGAWIKSGRRRR